MSDESQVPATDSKTVEFDNVGPISRLSIPVPAGGGLVVLRGRNGSGKSTVLQGIEALHDKGPRKALRNSDGFPSGKIEGFGVTIRLGRVNTSKGELTCYSLEGRCDPSVLVDPGIKNEEKADARRMQALVGLAGIKIPAADWLEATKDHADELSIGDLVVDDDPVATADKIRRALHVIAHAKERLAESKSGEAAAMSKTIADVDISDPQPASIQSKMYEVATEFVAEAQTQQNNYDLEHTRYTVAKENLAKLEPVDMSQLNDMAGVASHTVADLNQSIDTMEQIIAGKKRELQLAELEKTSTAEALKAGKDRLADRQKLEAILLPGEPERVEPEELVKAQAVKDAALQAMRDGEVVRRALETGSTSARIANEAAALLEVASAIRDTARNTDAVLEAALIDAGFDTIKIHGARLCVVDEKRGLIPFADLSTGERWRMSLELASVGLPEGSILPVRQEAFESLDPTHRNEVNAIAKRLRLVVFTAEATDGDLHAVVLP